MIRTVLLIAAALMVANCAPPQTALAQRPGPAADVPPITLGLRLLRSGEPSLALNAFNRALSEGELTAEALTGLGVALHQLGRSKVAARILRSAVDVKPNFAIAHNNLGVVLYELGDVSAALGELEIAYALTDGVDQTIATNLGITELAATRQPETIITEEDVAFDVIRFGHGVYRLEPRTTAPEDPT